MHIHQSVYCLIPPHILKKIAENGSPEQAQKARQTIVTTEQLRGRRHGIASMGALLSMTMAATQPGKYRTVYDARNGSSLPGFIARSEGQPPVSDEAVNEAYDGSGVTYDLFFEVYGRNSIDDLGMKLDSTVHYQSSYDNAFWDGRQMVYGDGDEDLPPSQRLFNRFTSSLDVIGHELTHGVTQFNSNLAYWDQAGALNESFSDVFGVLVKQYQLKQSVVDADWLIGAGLLTSNINGIALRSMKHPGTAYDDPVIGKDPQPAHMQDYVNTTQDNGGVHINSGIPNRAFYLVAVEIGGYAWEKAGRIWYKTLTEKLTERSDFQDAANKTYQVAGELFGLGSKEQTAVINGWAQVGISVTLTTPNTPVPVPENPVPSTEPEPNPAPQPNPEPVPTSNTGCLLILARLLGAVGFRSNKNG